MKLTERCYSTKIFRPKPIFHQEDDGSLVVVVNPWGVHEHAQKALEEVVKYINAAKSDVEVTSPFEYMTCLTDEGNYVRTALLIANEMLYRVDNRAQYLTGVEMLALFKRGSQVAWAQVGSPSLYIQRNGQSLQPLSVCHDLTSELQQSYENLPPLPGQLLGLESTANVQCGQTVIHEGDQLVLLSSSTISKALWTRESYQLNVADVTKYMIQEAPENPFWLGLIEF